MQDAVEFPGGQTVVRETGYDADGNSTIRVEVRALLCYTRTLVDNNNQLPINLAPGFRLSDLSPDVLTMLQLYHEHRHSNPCKYSGSGLYFLISIFQLSTPSLAIMPTIFFNCFKYIRMSMELLLLMTQALSFVMTISTSMSELWTISISQCHFW